MRRTQSYRCTLTGKDSLGVPPPIHPTARRPLLGDDHATGTTPDSTLFLTFTSGSTGRPKGVPVHHRGVLDRLAWQYLTHPPTDDEVGIAKTTLGFVDHLSELWGPLLAGQCVVLAPDETVRDASAFVELCARERIRRLVVVPSYLDALLDSAPDLGERLPTSPCSPRVASRFPQPWLAGWPKPCRA
ncbi:MAG: AMP-binding protein [Acidimicrobiales bacterium]